ncbi:MAG TPA: hypothetical protein VK790_13810 [Solirubrobacteraceae bacterium]|jgi:hypothetical protein|nr:hypothetical protein [Solirubrobacteraceae bacterium]
MANTVKQYFSERQGRGPKAEPIPFPEFREVVISVFDQLRERGYMQEAFGYDCVDAGDVDGILGSNPDAHFLRTIRRKRVWPYWTEVDSSFGVIVPAYQDWDEDTLFDVVEVMHDLVSRPVDGHYHDYAQCGWHYNTFDKKAGEAAFRSEMNGVLRMHDPPYEMNDQGQIVEAAPEEFHTLLSASVPEGTEPDIISKLDSATKRFRDRGASLDDRRVAVRDLADALEALREDIKDSMLSKDERELFHIANGFAIRHQNRQQRGDYDRLTWLRWAFYVYLATIHAVLRVREREEALPPTPTS